MILTYHEIVRTPSRYLYSTTTTRFQQHLSAIRDHKHEIAAPIITFDDGHASHYRYALPILAESQMRATFFVTAGWIGKKQEYMDWRQLADLLQMGHEVQAHGWSHAHLTTCTPQQLSDELRLSRLTLEDRLGISIDALSIPGGRYNGDVLQACCDEGYRRVFVSNPYLWNNTRYGVFVAGRAMVRNNQGPIDVVDLLRSEKRRFSAHRIHFRMKQAVRRVVGDRLYHDVLWRHLGSTACRAAIDQEYLDRPNEDLSRCQ